MSDFGFHLVRLTLQGSGVEPATIEFADGLNLISGPSDTGKTFILQCIDYMFGSKAPPKEIPEATRYEQAVLELSSREDRDTVFLLRRSLSGGHLTLESPDEEDVTLKWKHSGVKTDTVSHFLLEMSGLADQKVRKNARGETQSLSFRNVSRLCVVSEEDIIGERSPVITGQYTTKTAEQSVFRLLLSRVDDSSVVADVDVAQVQLGRKAKLEMVQELIESTSQRISDLPFDEPLEQLNDQFERSNTFVSTLTQELAETKVDVAELESDRRSLWEEIRNDESRLQVLRELDARFSLLEEQYKSDLLRLEAIKEAGLRLDVFGETKCLVCGAPKEHHDLDSLDDGPSPEEVAQSSKSESNKIIALLRDLQVTQKDVRAEIEELRGNSEQLKGRIKEINTQIHSQIKPRIGEALGDFESTRESRESLVLAIELHGRLQDLNELANELVQEDTTDSGQTEFRSTSASDLENFAKEIEARLKSWGFPDLDRVTFSETDLDVVISGRRRASHGKGVRALTHAAFNLALMKYCDNRNSPHPGVLIFDSPLVVYREPDADEEGFSSDVKRKFFEDLIENFADSQVIILENDELPADLSTSVNSINFTGTSVGRKGFLPEA